LKNGGAQVIYLVCLALGLLQGLTEFLPVSSSGHLVLAQHLFGVRHSNLVLETVLHLGTAFAIVYVYRKDIHFLITGPFSRDPEVSRPAWKSIRLVLLGSVPAGVAGVGFHDFFAGAFENPNIAAAMLLVTSALLFMTFWRPGGEKQIGYGSAFLIGCVQAFAILPGISRSGSTIAVALLLGISRKESGRFSFLLALPAIFGAALLEMKDLPDLGMPVSALALGFAVSLVSGIIALKLLIHFVDRGQMHYFGFYCAVVGTAALLLI
jgi:undecaprenyl-diphosphatase